MNRTIKTTKAFSPKIIIVLWLAFILGTVNVMSQSPAGKSSSEPEFFTCSELETLYDEENLPPALSEKLNRMLTTPIVGNSRKQPPQFSRSEKIGEFLRVAFWNIERGLEYEAVEAAFGDAAKFEALIDPKKFPVGSDKRREVLEESAALRRADIIIINEADYGMKRTGYRFVARQLAARLGMNFAFGVQFVELTPVDLSRKTASDEEKEKEILEQIKVDPARYRGLHGVAILSRFPLENVRLVPFAEQPYDWYKAEKGAISRLEKGIRKISKKLSLSDAASQVRRGGRTTLIAEIADPRFPGSSGRVTIAATHLENRAKPSGRVRQLKELLKTLKEIPHPVILAGDMNTSTKNMEPTSLERVLVQRYGNPGFWLKKAIPYTLGGGLGFVVDAARFGTVGWRKQNDSSVRGIPLIAPNAGEKFFERLKDFRFADGGAFDFRGNPVRSTAGRGSKLSMSNERAEKGFVTTYRLQQLKGFLGKYKLDWFFIKPANLKNPTDHNGSYLFAPHFGRTLGKLNEILENGISDHCPMIVDLPLGEPRLNVKR